MKEITGKIGFCNLLVSWCFQLCDIFKVLCGGGQVDPGGSSVWRRLWTETELRAVVEKMLLFHKIEKL